MENVPTLQQLAECFNLSYNSIFTLKKNDSPKYYLYVEAWIYDLLLSHFDIKQRIPSVNVLAIEFNLSKANIYALKSAVQKTKRISTYQLYVKAWNYRQLKKNFNDK